MKRSLCWLALVIFTGILILTGCSDDDLTPLPDEPKSVEQVGQIPDAFKKIVENNTFAGVAAFEDRLLKAEICSADSENRTVVQRVTMMDVYGEVLAEYECTSDDAYHVETLTATDDGGFLFVLGFQDYAYSQTEWASDRGVASHIIKCDSSGNLQFDTPLDGIRGAALQYCFEKSGRFYFFGDIETPDTKIQGISSYTDIYMTVLDPNGAVLNSRCIGGSNFDKLDAAEMSGNSFVLSCSAQSDDGDFAGSDSNGYPVDWTVEVNGSLEITKKIKGSGRDYFDRCLGEKDGFPVYKSSPLLAHFDAGIPQAFIDYGDFYLIVSENNTGIYENTPLMVSSIWYYTETVYSAYDSTGKLIFRRSVDSSPDFESWTKKFEI